MPIEKAFFQKGETLLPVRAGMLENLRDLPLMEILPDPLRIEKKNIRIGEGDSLRKVRMKMLLPEIGAQVLPLLV